MGDEQRGRRGGSELPPYAEELPLATSAPGPDEGLVVELGRPLYEARTWLRIVGVTLFVAAFFTALTIIGVAVAWLPVWMGILLWQAASAAEDAQFTGSPGALAEAQRKLKTYFIIQAVVMIPSMLVSIILFVMGLMQGLQQQAAGGM